MDLHQKFNKVTHVENVGQDDLILVLTFVVTHDVSTDQLSYPYNL